MTIENIAKDLFEPKIRSVNDLFEYRGKLEMIIQVASMTIGFDSELLNDLMEKYESVNKQLNCIFESIHWDHNDIVEALHDCDKEATLSNISRVIDNCTNSVRERGTEAGWEQIYSTIGNLNLDVEG